MKIFSMKKYQNWCRRTESPFFLWSQECDGKEAVECGEGLYAVTDAKGEQCIVSGEWVAEDTEG